MESVAKDILYALRVLRRNPGFTAAVVLSLGLGIGANTAIFTLLDAVLWRMLPITDPEHLLVVGAQAARVDVGTGFNYSAVPAAAREQRPGRRGGLCDRADQRQR